MGGRCEFRGCGASGAAWTVDPERPAFAYEACEGHAREAAADGWKVDGPDLEQSEDER